MPESDLLKFLLGEPSWMRLIRSALLIVALVYLYYFFYAIFVSDRLIFQPQPSSYRDTDRILKLTGPDGTVISARHLPNSQARYTVIFSHGNAEDLGHLEPLLQEYRSRGFAVISYDYSGYGTSGGTPSESTTYANIRTVYNYLTETKQIAPRDILLHGRSLGSGPSVWLATEQKVGGVILESAFTSAFRVMTRVRIFPFDKYNNLGRIARINAPVLLLHGSEDDIIPPRHSRQLYHRAGEPKELVLFDGAGHNDLLPATGENYWNALTRWAATLPAPTGN